VNSITKALHILELFSENDDGLTLGDITQLTGINESTVSHVVSTLVVNGFLCQPVNRGKYYLGVNFLNIAEALKYEDGKKITISYLAELSRLVNGTVGLEVWHRYGMKAETEQLGTNITNKQNWVKQISRDLKDSTSEIRNGEGYPVGIIFAVDFTISSTFHIWDKLISSIRVCALKYSRALAEKSDEMLGECIVDAQSITGAPGWDLKESINTITAFDKRSKPLNSITKVLLILKVFSDNDNGLTLGDIAKSAGLARSTVSRLVSTLAINGFLVQLKKRGKYFLGVRFLDIAGTI
jgi:DNA-binding IclR family transcriptional regulator